MTNEKNNIENLVSGVDDDPTSELEILSHALVRSDSELEADATTYECDENRADFDTPTDTIASLKRSIRQRDECIDRLQFDIEQLRARWTGLDREIKVREELTDNLNAELRKARNELGSLSTKLKHLDSNIDPVELERQSARYELMLGTLREQLEGLRLESSALKAERDARDAQLSEVSQALQEATRQAGELTEQLAVRDARLAEQSAQFENLRQQAGQAQERLTLLQRDDTETPAVANDVSPGLGDEGWSLAADRSGQLATSRQEMRELQLQFSRTEDYADSLRIKLLDQIRIADEAARSKAQTELSLADAQQQIAELGAEIEDEKQLTAALREQLEMVKSSSDTEVGRIRTELDAAVRAIADQETANEQLTSDLMDNQSFRLALEMQLEKLEQTSEVQIRDLRQKIRRLEHQHDEDRHKISNKDGAIAALLSELANRSSTVRGIGSPESIAVQQPDSGFDDRQDDKSVADRVTRLLVGNVDGQELRFPLFKDRLTIGRTKQNDIHLKAQYISRRHALIVTENERTKIVDWGSKNGIAVNKRTVTEHVLRSGDVVTIGTADFRYEERPKR